MQVCEILILGTSRVGSHGGEFAADDACVLGIAMALGAIQRGTRVEPTVLVDDRRGAGHVGHRKPGMDVHTKIGCIRKFQRFRSRAFCSTQMEFFSQSLCF
jgi:hypothetical protein